jgi:hypothetical protein
LDLLNDNDISPQDVDREALEKALFDRPDPYDLDETTRVDETISAEPASNEPRVHRSSTLWAVADYVRLDSLALAKLISPPKTDATSSQETPQATATTATAANEDWDVDD